LIVHARVSRWGNSLAIRIPAAFAEEVQLQDGASVNILVENGRLVITAARPRYRLDELVGEITDENLHGETDWGPSMGSESW
jgi:antitoxin MazE